MMMVVWVLFGYDDIKVLNVLCMLLVGVINFVVVVCFVFVRMVWWL